MSIDRVLRCNCDQGTVRQQTSTRPSPPLSTRGGAILRRILEPARKSCATWHMGNTSSAASSYQPTAARIDHRALLVPSSTGCSGRAATDAHHSMHDDIDMHPRSPTAPPDYGARSIHDL
jgi:hypothetical protein